MLTGMNPLKNCSALTEGMQGCEKSARATEWFFGWNVNWMIEPTGALTEDGLKTRTGFAAETWIGMTCELELALVAEGEAGLLLLLLLAVLG